MFVDRVKLQLKAGSGGNGVVAWRREKYIPKGGPCGGNGGKGGRVVLQADVQIPSLDAFRHRRLVKAENGRCGGGNRQQGRSGKDALLLVPCGTLVKDAKTGEVLFDLTEDGQRVALCEGGRGGKGNTYFKSPTNRAPTKCTPGKLGQESAVELELKLIADVGFVGFPNAGKSTLVTKFTNIRVKTAPYPFTTLFPNLGYRIEKNGERILFADIPGIIAGAHQNRGLGFEFLRHIERTELLVFILDASGIDGRDPLSDFITLTRELNAYNSALLDKPFLVALNKIDDLDSKEHIEAFKKEYSLPESTLFEISALGGNGLDSFLTQIQTTVRLLKRSASK